MPDRWIYDEISNTWKGDYSMATGTSPISNRPDWLPYPYTVKQLPRLRSRDFREVYFHFLRQPETTYRNSAVVARAFSLKIKSVLPDFPDLHLCQECETPISPVDQVEPRPGIYLDPECFAARWATCFHCEVASPLRELIRSGERNSVCAACRGTQGYVTCEECGYIWHPETEHSHPQCCESPQQLFTIRNDGQDPLANDTRVQIQFAQERIDQAGINRIYRLLHGYNESTKTVAPLVHEMDPAWQMRSGNFTRRLSSNAWKTHRVKLPPEILSEVGNIAAQHTQASGFANIEITRNLNLPANQFSHGGSCWWSNYSSSRCSLKSNGGFGLRSFAGDEVSGRAWVLPVKYDPNSAYESNRWKPTFDTMAPDAFIVFNGYNELNGYLPARLMAHMMGTTYKKIDLSLDGMYVNNENGYLVGPEDILHDITSISMYVDSHSDLYQEEHG